ncbi:carboxymuconolactone decarboxylase family protein [Amycolatopsis australiensis]|uniref:Alkylhydroperoxidase AhpD family core domain-containing protein n=1 Tax=Amycolatopsis australiensis TaxID=546364 RepID=A0A1K1RKG7_9PSEU|nr:carboxymuconolactone decarboxylase family protein [Amycolatopsis australiensis]SFW72332.1 alkylhydroperoxidase AhpD family core domain-containing protein [Amycolatopsis australiensis]
MTPGLVRVALRRTLRDVKYVEAVRPRRARGLVRDVYRQVERDFGMLAPPIALHSPAPDVLAAAWLMLRESLVARGSASRAEKEVVAAAVSAANSCPYCVEVHGMALGSLGEPSAAAAIEAGAVVPDADTRALAAWASGEGDLPADAPAAEFTAVAVAFHYLNRVVSVFLGPSPLPDAVPQPARAKAKAILGFLLKPGLAPAPGEALGLLPPTAADGPGWAAPGSTLADAFARAGAAVEAAGERSVPSRVRDLVRREVKAWDGKPPGLSRAWAEPVLAELPAGERAAGRLALLTAKAAYQIGSADVAAVRPQWTDDRALVELVSWAARTAAVAAGDRLAHRPRREDSPRRRGR